MGFYRGPNIVTNGLILALDAGNIKSYQSGSLTWYDKSGNGRTGTLTNGPTFSTGSGGSIVFDGTNDYILVNSPQSLNPGTGSMTLEGWCKTNQEAQGNGLVEARGTSLYGFLFIINYPIGSKKISLFVNPNNLGSQASISSTTSPIIVGSWQHIAVVLNRTLQQCVFYYNGIQTGTPVTINYTGSIDPGSGYIYRVGGDLGGNPINGNIAISRQYNRILSAEEIQQNYNATKGRFNL